MSTLDHLINAKTLNFYGWWQAVTCFFAFLALMAIWWHLGKRKKDYSQIWLALSVLCWSITGIVEIIYTRILQSNLLEFIDADSINSTSSELSLTQLDSINIYTFQLDGYSSLLSLANSFFILMALPWFKHIPKSIHSIVKSRYWIFIIGLPFVFSVLPTVSKVILNKSYGMINELDVYYSILTLGFLGYVLWESFDKRRLKLLAWLSVVCILITFTAQILKVSGNEIDMRIFSAIFKSALIMIFFALALSWVKDLAENILPSAGQLFIGLISKVTSSDKVSRLLRINGIPGKKDLHIPLTQGQFELMDLFIKSKLDNDKWLEIKPKSELRNKNYAIKDYNEIKRLTSAILDGIFGKSNWTKETHEQALKDILLEFPAKRERKIRLRIPAANILKA